MPIISVKLISGRMPQQKQALMRGLAETAARTLNVPTESVRVILTEIEAEHWGIGTKTKAEIDRSGS